MTESGDRYVELRGGAGEVPGAAVTVRTRPRRAHRDVQSERNTAYPDTAYGEARYTGQLQTANGLLFLVALWLVVAPWVLSYDVATGVAYVEMATGTAVAAVALLRLTLPSAVLGLVWVAFALGLWTICAPFVLGYPVGFDRAAALWNGVLSGAAVVALAGWQVVVTDNARSAARTAARTAARLPR